MPIDVTLKIKGNGIKRWDLDFYRGPGDNHVELRDPRKEVRFSIASHGTYLISYIVRGRKNTDFDIVVNDITYQRRLGEQGVDASAFWVGI